MKTLFLISECMLAGLLMTRLVRKYKLPDVTSFLVAGVLVGPCFLGKIGAGFATYSEIEALSVISQAALGFIAFSIGNEFRLNELKNIGKQALVIGVLQALITAILVDAVLIITHFVLPDFLSLSAAITLGAIATATAPAATLMVVKQYRAKGELTKLLLPIVALDDAVGLIVFAVSFGIAKAIQIGTLDIVSIIINPTMEIISSLAVGVCAGTLLTYIENKFYSDNNRESLGVAFVFFTVAWSMQVFEAEHMTVSFSSLLTCMMMGAVFCNTAESKYSAHVMDIIDHWTAPLLVLFFVISGAELELEVFKQPMAILIGVIYILFRSIGKYSGAYISSSMTHCSEKIRKYLGITLLPQAGVALGMCVTARELSDGSMIRNIVLFAVLIYEIFGPLLTKWALTKSGDIKA